MPDRTLVLLVGIVVIVGFAGVSLAFSPTLDIEHEYHEHDHTIQEVVYDEQHDMLWSLDHSIEESVTLIGYDVADEAVAVSEPFGTGHALAVGDGSVYIADGDTVWEYDVAEANLIELFEPSGHAAAMAYDSDRDWIWVAADDEVNAYDATDGEQVAGHTAHTDETADIAVSGDYVASGTTWEDEVIVWDIETEEVIFEPELNYEGTVVDLTSAGELIVGAGEEVVMFDIETGEQLLDSEGHVFGTSGVAYHADEDLVVSVGFDDTMRFHSIADGGVIESYGHDDTIYTVSLDLQNQLVWFGDGEGQPGTVYGLDMAEAATPTPTPTPVDPTPTPADPTPTPPPEDPTPTPTPDEPTPTPPEDDDDGIPGPGIFGTILALAAVGYGLTRYRNRSR